MRTRLRASLKKSAFYSLLPLVLTFAGYAQTSGTPTISSHKADPAKPVPLPHLYWHFLIYQQHLEDTANAREKQGLESEWLRNYVQAKLGFTDAEYAPIRASASRLNTEVLAMNGQAKTIIAADRAARRKGLIPADEAPPGIAKLKTLTGQREAAIQSEIDSINKTLSVDKQAALQKFLTGQFSQNVIATKVPLNKHFARPFVVGTAKPTSVQP
jgi:hypothetical protein